MEARLTRPAVQVHPDLRGPDGKQKRRQIIARYFREKLHDKTWLKQQLFVAVPAGTVVSHPQAWRLVKLGKAEPVDFECRAAAGYSEGQIEAAQLAGEALERAQATGLEEWDATDDEADAAIAKQFETLNG